MVYRALRWAARVALHWYYGDIAVHGAERVPARGPLLVVANHPNALVDALLVATTLQRRVLLTAKATIFENPLLAPLLHVVGVVPLRRAADERAAAASRVIAPGRNADSFRAVRHTLQRGNAVLIFPEGISHDRPGMAPLKTGAARMALDAHDRGVRDVAILPLGLVYERKESPRSRVLVRVGEPLDIDRWCSNTGASDAAGLTTAIDDALRAVTLNFASDARAERAVALASALAAIAEPPAPLAHVPPLGTESDIARRVERATEGLTTAAPAVATRADDFITRVAALGARLAAEHIALQDVRISPLIRHGAYFVAREGLVVASSLPFAMLGRIAHWLPIRLARFIAMRPTATDPSRDLPAMRTIQFGVGFVLVWYLLLGGAVVHWLGWGAAVATLALIFLGARIDFVMHDRRRRAYRRARTYLALRRNPALRSEVLGEIDALLADAISLENELVRG